MSNNKINIRLDDDQISDFEILKKYNFNRNALIRIAINKYLYSEFRTLLNKARRDQVRNELAKKHPDWAL